MPEMETLGTTGSPATTQTQTTGVATSTETQQQQLPQTNYQQFIDKDTGLLQGDWKNKYVPEDMRHEKVYDKLVNMEGVFKQIGVLDRAVGKKGVVVPGKDALPSEIDAFHRALGRPDKPEDYKIEFTEELKDYYDPKTIETYKGVAHKIGLNPSQAQAIMNLKMEMDNADIAFMQQDEERELQETEDALRAKWGSAYDTRAHLARYMVDHNTEIGKQREEIVEKLEKDPVMGDFIATIAKKFVESGALRDVEMTNAITPAEAESQMKEKIAEHQAHVKWKYDNPAGYAREEKEIDNLAKIAASGGR